MATHEQYVIDEAGKRTAVLVPLEEWERIQAALEELADIRAYDEAKRHPSDSVPFEQAMAEIESNTGD
jgi:PHD/YefM family antitoxin component YafN of YafNO toxin-antitoxin module